MGVIVYTPTNIQVLLELLMLLLSWFDFELVSEGNHCSTWQNTLVKLYDLMLFKGRYAVCLLAKINLTVNPSGFNGSPLFASLR